MKIQVRPIERLSWHGKTGKESFKNVKIIQALPNPNTFKYETGLEEEDVEWLKKQGVAYDLSDSFIEGVAHPFWDSPTAFVHLENATKIYDTNKPIERIHVGVMKASPYVANSMREYEQGLFPEATHVIFSEAEENEIVAARVDIKNKAIVASMKLSDAKKANIIMIITGKNFRGKDSNTITVEYDKVLEANPKAVLKQAEGDSETLALHALVLEALQKSVLKKTARGITYFETLLGLDEYDAIEFLKEEDNQEIKLRLINTVQ